MATCVTGYNYGYQEVTGITINNIVILGPTGITGGTGSTGTTGTTGITGATGAYKPTNLSVTFGGNISFNSSTSFSGQINIMGKNTITQIWGT